MTDQSTTTGQQAAPKAAKLPYSRPELLKYGALDEVTRTYTQTRTCTAGCTNG